MKTKIERLDQQILDLTLARVYPPRPWKQVEWDELADRIVVLERERTDLIAGK